jgi:hypothetical protein
VEVAYIFVDLDIRYSAFRKLEKYWKEHLDWVIEHLRLDAKVISYRAKRSGSGNTHVLVYLDRPVPELDALHLAAALGGDFKAVLEARLRLDALGFADYVPWEEKKEGKKG